MKKLLYLTVVIAVTVVCATGCKPKQKIASPAEVAKVSHEYLKDGNYDAFVNDCISYDRNAPVEAIRTEKANNVRIMKTNAKSVIHKNGGIKNVVIKSEKIAPNGRNAEVILTNKYHNGTSDDVVYSMLLDNDNRWRVKMGHDRQLWKTVSSDGTSRVFKLKEDNTQIHHRDIWKEKETEPANVVNKNDAVNRTIVPVRRKVVKDKGTARREVVKLKEGGRKEVVKVTETPGGEVIKIKEDGRKQVFRERDHADMAAIEAEAAREIEKIREEPAEVMYETKATDNLVKVLERGNRRITEIRNDGRKTIIKDKHTNHKDIVKFRDDGGQKGFVKVKNDANREVYKEKFNGKKSFIKVIERKNDILVKTLDDGHRDTEKIKK